MKKRRYSIGILCALVVVVLGRHSFDGHVTEHFVADQSTAYHAAMYYFDNADFFPQSVKTFEHTQPLSVAPHVFIVNQHILAAHVIARQFALAAHPNIKTVIVITQNNWNVGSGEIITSKYQWKTRLGDIQPAVDVVDRFVDKNVATVDESIFTTEHGITGIVPYVAHSFPGAKIVPLVIRDGTSDGVIDRLVQELSRLDPAQTVIIGTIDGSHYLPKYVADIHDRLTIQSIKNFDYDTLPRLDIDTVPTLRAILKVAEERGQRHFVVTDDINSAEIVADPELMSTTSYISGYFTDTAPASQSKKDETAVHALFLGDIMLDRTIVEHAEKYGINSLFGKIERLFLGNHAVIGNLEGTITSNESIARKNHSILRFTFKPLFADLLKSLNITAVSLANNHSSDFGEDGYVQTQRKLTENGIISFGSSRNDQNISTVLTLGGKKICLIGYHDLYTMNPTPALKEIEAIHSECFRTVVFAHWGIEYEQIASERQKLLAHKFIDAGADLIIGAHPHVVEPVEIYKNKAIFYSLGNFMFDQDFSYTTQQGLAVQVEWGDTTTRFNLIPTSIVHGEATIAEAKDRQATLEVVTQQGLSQQIKSDILRSKYFTLWNNNITQ